MVAKTLYPKNDRTLSRTAVIAVRTVRQMINVKMVEIDLKLSNFEIISVT